MPAPKVRKNPKSEEEPSTERFANNSASDNIIDLRDYLRSNWSGLRNYAVERRKGLRISIALAESVMSHLVNQRMGKRQPMRWSCEGAHLLLQVRCAVLDKQLDTLFREWHPNFRKQHAAPLPIV